MEDNQSNNSHEFNTAQNVLYTMNDKKKKAKLIILLGIIWVVITLPLPWVINNPQVSESQLNIMLSIIGVLSIPFIMLGVAWTLKPELTT
jgi:hypothetical protein